MMEETRRKLIETIHHSGRRAVIAVTGGGSLAISDLLTVPGASAFVLESLVPYSPAVLTKWLGREPEAFCSRETALAMATVALRNVRLIEPNAEHPIGLSCSASLASDRPKRGDHRAWIAAQSLTGTWLLGIRLDKGHRDRLAEERLVADLLLRVTSEACGLHHAVDMALTPNDEMTCESHFAHSLVADVCHNRARLCWSLPCGAIETVPKQPIVGLLSGSFNPLHVGHRELVMIAERHLNGPVAFELAVMNVDKPPLDFLTIETRRRQFHDRPIALTTAATFAEKSRLFPQVTFVVGLDTAERIIQPKYYDDDEAKMLAALCEIRMQQCRFLVAGRCEGGSFRTLKDLTIPHEVCDLFVELPASQFRCDVSSTELRRGEHPASLAVSNQVE